MSIIKDQGSPAEEIERNSADEPNEIILSLLRENMFDYEWRCHQAGLRYRLISTIVFSSEYFKSVQKILFLGSSIRHKLVTSGAGGFLVSMHISQFGFPRRIKTGAGKL